MPINYDQKDMSALTERRKREIMEQYQRMRVPRRFILSIIYDTSNINEIPSIERNIMDAINRMPDIESYTPYHGENIIAVTARWTESEKELRVEELGRIPGVMNVQARIIEHGIAGPRVIPPASPTFSSPDR